MKKHNISIGDRFGRLTVVGMVKNKRNTTVMVCKCECGKEKTYEPSNLALGKTNSCGCLQKEIIRNYLSKRNEYAFIEDYVIGKTSDGTEFFIDKADYERVSPYCWCRQKNGYIVTDSSIIGRVSMHRFLMNPPADKVVDHINHNKADNRRRNLRVCTTAENSRNRLAPPKGICAKHNKNNTYYSVYLRGKYYGNFKDYEKAIEKRNEVWEQIKND